MLLRRRTFLALTAATLWPRVSSAQPARALPRIGWLSLEAEPDPFIDGLRERSASRPSTPGAGIAGAGMNGDSSG